VTSFPPNSYVTITRTILTNLRLDVRLVSFLVTSFPSNRYVPITRTLLTILTFRESFILFSQLNPPPPRLSVHTSYFLAPYSASSRYRSQSLSPTRRLPSPAHRLKSNEHVNPTLYSPPQCARRLLLSSAAPHHPLRLHHGNRAISASYFARRHIGPTIVQSIRILFISVNTLS